MFFWVPPNVGWIKVNTYGSSMGKHPMETYGAIFRNCRWTFVQCFSKNIGI